MEGTEIDASRHQREPQAQLFGAVTNTLGLGHPCLLQARCARHFHWFCWLIAQQDLPHTPQDHVLQAPIPSGTMVC